MSLSCSPDLLSTEASMRSVTVGTRTSATLTASASCPCVIGLSSGLSRVSKSSRIRSSIASGSLRVTMTSGFLLFAICPQPRQLAAIPPGSADLALINRARPHCESCDIRSFFLPDGRDNTKLPVRSRRPRIGSQYRSNGSGLACRGRSHRLDNRLCKRPSDPAFREPQVRPRQCQVWPEQGSGGAVGLYPRGH